MIVYQSTKQGFREDVFSNRIDEKILSAYISHLGRSTSSNEILSWKNSMSYMDRILEDPDIPDDAGMFIEFQIPLTTKRVDFIITGLNENQEGQVINNPCYEPYTTEALPFFRSDAGKLRKFIKKYVKYGDPKDILYKIENGRLRPSKQLSDSLGLHARRQPRIHHAGRPENRI